MLASTLSLRAVGPATVLSHKCNILSLLKDNKLGRDNRLPVHCRHLASRRHRTAIPVATPMSLNTPCLFTPCLNVPNFFGKKKFRSGKLQNESFPNFSIFRPEFCPEFCSEFSPNFSRTFRASFRGRRRPEKIHQNSPQFFNAKFPDKHEKNIHKILLESRQSKNSRIPIRPPPPTSADFPSDSGWEK